MNVLLYNASLGSVKRYNVFEILTKATLFDKDPIKTVILNCNNKLKYNLFL